MTDTTILPFSFPAVARKKITAAFDGGRLTSDGGVMLLALADRRVGVADKLSCVFPEWRDPSRIVHSLADMIRARIFAIACGYEDGNDLDRLRNDPAFKLACGRLPDTDRDLCSQPTLSRLENAPCLREVIRLSYALVELWMDSYERAQVDEASDAVRTKRAVDNQAVVRGYTETRHAAGSWHRERRVVARIEATEQGLDIRYVVTSLRIGSAEWIYDSLYCARGQAENLIKLHKSQLASDRTSCRSALANQVRLVLHTAAYWLILTVRDAIPKPRDLATAEFTTIRLRLLKIAARVTETAGRVRLAFAAACPEADLFRGLANALIPQGP